MEQIIGIPQVIKHRYKSVSRTKSNGMTYTPTLLANFVAGQLVSNVVSPSDEPLRVFDPAVGDGELLVSLVQQLKQQGFANISVYGFEIDENALRLAQKRLEQLIPAKMINIEKRDFLDFIVSHLSDGYSRSLFDSNMPEKFDLIIANPPYVRTQILGAEQAGELAMKFGLKGRVDLYYPFIIGIGRVLHERGLAGIIVSNRFMTTKSGMSIRQSIRELFDIIQVWDLGDTKIFRAAVLPAVLLLQHSDSKCTCNVKPKFTSIYETNKTSSILAEDPIEALRYEGVVQIKDGRNFLVEHGVLDIKTRADSIWRVADDKSDAWIETVRQHTWRNFGDIGKIRVGIKTTADSVFIRSDWDTLPKSEQPEILFPLTTHHIARRFKPLASENSFQVLYPHEVIQGKRCPVELSRYPHTAAYLEKHRKKLESRKYVIESGRNWYEIWVPQDPDSWKAPKLIFRDISKEPTFWLDLEGSIVNGDCYWLKCDATDGIDLLWLALGVSNSEFIEVFYDRCFHNKLYAGRRRFITQYVEKFPLPDPDSRDSREIIEITKRIYDVIDSNKTEPLIKKLNQLVWRAFGLSVKKI